MRNARTSSGRGTARRSSRSVGAATQTTDGLPETCTKAWVTPKCLSSRENERPAKGCQIAWTVVRPSHSKGSAVITLRSAGSSDDARRRPKGAKDSSVIGSMTRRCRRGAGAGAGFGIWRRLRFEVRLDVRPGVSIQCHFDISRNTVDNPDPQPYIASMTFEIPSAAAVLAELGNETRLAIVRNLVRAGRDGLTVGEIQRATGVPGSTLTHHIRRLCQVGLVSQTRRGSTLWCRADTDLVHSLAHYLIEECCAGEGRRREADAA